ncbi:EAL domain-containing protein [Caballeronia sp. LZ034LL]|uniref:putative bifunctional diguanylate cyclase/phosphodiesterase n=1 Tax=Caballeronia sp. LZ034LL TaxID=3038567 RepID=UPI0028668585|nr:EAL domain-containing protein [Caballeronia sp. LZ034LL]MDR5839403.1 EAL domain-containing protein [Caballeronia sp. LZ034LL]
MLATSYNPLLVVCSLFVAILASYTALDMAGRVASAKGLAGSLWLVGGGCAMGLGIWSMHFVGMLAFDLPIPVGYDPTITFFSLLIAVAASTFALWLVSRYALPWRRLMLGSLLMGPAIAGMHYTGMAAMQMNPVIDYDWSLVALSIVIAVAASGAALWTAFHIRGRAAGVFLFRGGASLLMGSAIVGMHYTGMAAAHFPLGSICEAARHGTNTSWLAAIVIIVTVAVLSIALIVSVLELRLELRTAALSRSLAEANKELIHLALHDSLTKLPNRVLLDDRLNQLIQRGRHFTLMFLDLDGFKAVNDAFGHQVGDRLLVDVARRIGASVRANDTFARVGGDEFVLLCEVTRPVDVAKMAATLIRIVEEPYSAGEHEIQVSTSIGIACHPEHGRTQSELLTSADTAMYRAKAMGRNNYCFFEPSMHADAYEHMQLARELRTALSAGQLVLHYQPKFQARGGPVVGAEALLRWKHPSRGLMAPDEFLPIAEKSGLMVPIGEWALNEACRQMRIWVEAGHTDWSVAVNLSATQFVHTSLVQVVRQALVQHRLEPRHLILEITESTAMHDVEVSLSVLKQLRETGVRIAIDDFGTGYSSLLYLKRLPAHELKIDRGFIRDLRRDTEDAAIVAAIVALGRTLNLRVVAEGVETEEQQAFLGQLGCDMLQGFLLGRPMAPEQFMKTVEAGRVVSE